MKHSVYFDGHVQSLELETHIGRATVGVIKPGKYTFTTASEEHMKIIEGEMNVKLPEEAWKKYKNEDGEFIVSRNASFEIEAIQDVAYICYYI
jgi:purine/pyrimidine-nucleoside phosphorylase